MAEREEDARVTQARLELEALVRQDYESWDGMPAELFGALVRGLFYNVAHGALPRDRAACADVLGVSTRHFDSVWELIGDEFDLVPAGFIRKGAFDALIGFWVYANNKEGGAEVVTQEEAGRR